MKRTLLNYYLSAVSILIFSCSGPEQGHVEKTVSGIVIHFNDESTVKLLKLEPITDQIIHVTVSSVDSFSREQSLMILPQLKSTTSWEVLESEGEVTIQTPRLKATVLLTTGEVIFKDSLGNVILQEQKGGGKTFKEVAINGDRSYSIRQVFESPEMKHSTG